MGISESLGGIHILWCASHFHIYWWTQVRGFSMWMTLDHLHLLCLKLWITKLGDCFERLCIPRIRPLELVRAVEWYNSFLLLLWVWKLLHEEFSSYSDGDQKPWFHDVLFQLFYSSLEAPSLVHVPMTGGWGRRGGRGRAPGPSMPRKFLTGTGMFPRLTPWNTLNLLYSTISMFLFTKRKLMQENMDF